MVEQRGFTRQEPIADGGAETFVDGAAHGAPDRGFHVWEKSKGAHDVGLQRSECSVAKGAVQRKVGARYVQGYAVVGERAFSQLEAKRSLRRVKVRFRIVQPPGPVIGNDLERGRGLSAAVDMQGRNQRQRRAVLGLVLRYQPSK